MSNWMRFHTQIVYWSGRGLSSPMCLLISRICSSVSSTCASPMYRMVGSGPSRVRMNMTTVAPMMEITMERARLARNLPMDRPNPR